MARIDLAAENFKPVEDHPLILVAENKFKWCNVTTVLNVVNRIAYMIFKNDNTSFLLGSTHVDYNKDREPMVLDDVVGRLYYLIRDDLLDPSTTKDDIYRKRFLCSLDYIENGVIKSIDSDATVSFNALKEVTTDKEVVEVIEKILNE